MCLRSRRSWERQFKYSNRNPLILKSKFFEPESILERRMVNREEKAVTEVLVKWKHLPVEEDSW